MRKLIVVSFALTLIMSMMALAQYEPKQDDAKQSNKAVNVSGKVSDDGKTFVSDDGKTWTISNPEALKGHEGHQVILNAHVYPDKNEVHVMSVKMGKAEGSDNMKKDDSPK